MEYRYVKYSNQGLRFDVINADNYRICITHSEADAKLIVKALDYEARKKEVIKAGMGRKCLRM